MRPAGGSDSAGGGTNGLSTCGDGLLEQGEACDCENLGGETCASATLGRLPEGTLGCSTTCVLQLTDCRSTFAAGGATGTGGFTSTGGVFGTGGSLGGGGALPIADAGVGDCYSLDGVPDPTVTNVCYLGPLANDHCIDNAISINGDTSTNETSCGAGCGCAYCPSLYDHCAEQTYGGIELLACISRCGTVDCQSNCYATIQTDYGVSPANLQLRTAVRGRPRL